MIPQGSLWHPCFYSLLRRVPEAPLTLLDDTAREPVAPLFYSLLRRVPEAHLTLLDETAREPVAPLYIYKGPLGISNIFPKIITIFNAKKVTYFPPNKYGFTWL